MSLLVEDTKVVILSIASATVVYLGLQFICTSGSQIPLLASVFTLTNMLSRTDAFRKVVSHRLARSQRRPLTLFGARDLQQESQSVKLAELSNASKVELLTALDSLRAYTINSRKASERRRKLYKAMSWRQQKLCDEAGYSRKLQAIDNHIEKNQLMFSNIVSFMDDAYGLTYKHYDAIKASAGSSSQNTSSSNYRVIEALGHFVRDWTETGEPEVGPMVQYVKDQLDAIIPKEEAEKTCVIVPGSGLGRVAHEIADHRNYGAVHAVEFSGLMHACNQFVYSAYGGNFYPYIHTTSNFLTQAAQFREAVLPSAINQPPNLHLHLDDFCYFSLPDRDQYKNVVVVTVFFIDTAENIIDYFDQISQLAMPSRKTSVKNGYWINYGPLKYGSAAQAELNAAEVAHVRKNMGWIDLHAVNSLEEPSSPYCNHGVSGYITDKESMWQGYYGVSMWASRYKSNERK